MNISYVNSFANAALHTPAEMKELDYLQRLAHRIKAATKKLQYEQEKGSEGSAVSRIGRIRQITSQKVKNSFLGFMNDGSNLALMVLSSTPVRAVVPNETLGKIAKGLGHAFMPHSLTGATALNNKFNVSAIAVSSAVAERVNDYIEGHVFAADQTAKNLVRTFKKTANEQQRMFGPWRPETQSLVEDLVSGRIQPEQFESAFSERLLAFNDITKIQDTVTQQPIHIITPERVVKIREGNALDAGSQSAIETEVKILVFNVKANPVQSAAKAPTTPIASAIPLIKRNESFGRVTKDSYVLPYYKPEDYAASTLSPQPVPSFK